MEKGLSKRQKQILLKAIEHEGSLTNHQALVEIYGFPIAPGRRNIDRSRVDFNRYNAAAVAVVKSFNRLTERGLAVRKHNFGIILSPAGVATAERVLDETRSNKT